MHAVSLLWKLKDVTVLMCMLGLVGSLFCGNIIELFIVYWQLDVCHTLSPQVTVIMGIISSTLLHSHKCKRIYNNNNNSFCIYPVDICLCLIIILLLIPQIVVVSLVYVTEWLHGVQTSNQPRSQLLVCFSCIYYDIAWGEASSNHYRSNYYTAWCPSLL